MYIRNVKYDEISETRAEKLDEIEELFTHVFNVLEDTREKSIAITKLDEALLWSRAAIAHDQRIREMLNGR